ncbi:MAG: RHS repeat protein [Desulfobacteraceae bacterium]|nr:RHS repeat protein [Desulfobacteraceae bacterium]
MTIDQSIELSATGEPDSIPIIWSSKTVDGDAEVEITANENGTGVRVTAISGSGYVEITASSQFASGCNDKIYINVQECGCSDGFCPEIDVKSLHMKLGLGKTKDGFSAGGIYLKSKLPTPQLSDPSALKIYSSDAELIYKNAIIRQVTAPQVFVDILPTSSFSYTIKYYHPQAKGALVDGIYETIADAQPFESWSIENPDASPDIYNRLRIIENKGAETKIHEFVYDAPTQTWTLSKANGVVIKSKSEQVVAGDRISTELIKESDGTIVSKKQTTFRSLTVNGNLKEEIIQIVEDPDEVALTTTTQWYEDPCPDGSCGRIKSRIFPDGSWVRYEYDILGRKTLEIKSVNDLPLSASVDTAHTTYYDYSPISVDDAALAQDQRLPRKITVAISGQVVSKIFYVYKVDASGLRTTISERAGFVSAEYGNAENLRTKEITFAVDSTTAEAGKIKSRIHPDGRQSSYVYLNGVYSPASSPSQAGSFSSGTQGSDVEEILTNGTIISPEGTANKTTREINIYDHVGNLMQSETQVYTGTLYETIEWETRTYDDLGRLKKTRRSNGTETDTTWSCCGKESETDVQGITRSFGYDDMKRLDTEIKLDPAGDLITQYTYDAAGRRLSQTISGGSLSLSTESTYDLAGRIKTHMDQAGLTTTYDYSLNHRITTVTRPGGATEITEIYQDGRIKSISGTGVVAKDYEYGVNTDGSQWTTVHTGELNGPMWEKTTTDMLGRVIKIEKPGSGGPETIEHSYDQKGLLVKTIFPGRSDTLYVYDDMGSVIQTGLDLDANGLLDPAGIDRITATDTSYVLDIGIWYQESRTVVFATDHDASPTTVSIQSNQLTGLGAEGKIAASVSTDIHGNQTIGSLIVDRINKIQKQITDYPDSQTDAETVHSNGRVTSVTSKTGVNLTFGYDTLDRRITATDPRTGTTTTQYNLLGQVEWVEDAAGFRTTFGYDALTGLKISETDAMGGTKRYRYNAMNQIDRIWGTTAEPVRYEFDDFGRMIEMHTYRTTAAFSGATFPETIMGDITRWHYDPATALLTAKEYSDGSQTAYTYETGGGLHTRTWARTDGVSPLVTTYTYDPDTGELLGIDYSDTTPDITFTYDRLGRQTTITDALGNRTFAYNNTLQLESETLTGLYTETLTRSYDTITVPGRITGLTLGAGYTVGYDFDFTGRLDEVDWNAGTQTGTAEYTRVHDTDLLQSVTRTGGLQTTYSYEPKRNLKTVVEHTRDVQIISSYTYQYDKLYRRSSLITTGTAFDTAQPPALPEQQITYTTNALNQYDQVTTDTVPAPLTYDADGNLTEITTDSITRTYTYNAENRLIVVAPKTPADGDKKVLFTYDYMGRRVQKQTQTFTAGVWTDTAVKHFVYDGWNVIHESCMKIKGNI